MYGTKSVPWEFEQTKCSYAAAQENNIFRQNNFAGRKTMISQSMAHRLGDLSARKPKYRTRHYDALFTVILSLFVVLDWSIMYHNGVEDGRDRVSSSSCDRPRNIQMCFPCTYPSLHHHPLLPSNYIRLQRGSY